MFLNGGHFKRTCYFSLCLVYCILFLFSILSLFLTCTRMVLPPWEDLDQETKKISSCFLRYHLDDCTRQVVRDITSGLRTHRGVARGRDLVTWVVERGLAHTRQEAESLCRHLVRGRVVRHVDNHLDLSLIHI